MIIVITNISDLAKAPEKLQAFNNIIMAFGEGKHVLWMPSSTISEIIESNTIHGRNLSILHELKDSSRISKSILEQFEFFVEVDFTNNVSSGFCEPNRLVISYSHYIDSAAVQLPIFVAENLCDIDFYLLGSKVYLRKVKLLSSHEVRFRPINGGGNTTIVSFEQNLKSNELVLCILDSDKNHPAAGIKETAARFANYPLGWGSNYWLHILQCTEAENLVPWKVAEGILSKNPDPTYQQFLALTTETRRYFDHKKGLTYLDAVASDKHYGVEFWSAHLPENHNAEQWICAPLGSKFLEKCIEAMNKTSIHKLTEMIDERDELYLKLCKMVASWGVGPKRAIR